MRTLPMESAAGCDFGKVMEAAKHAHAHSFIKRMPNGYDTVISEERKYFPRDRSSFFCIARVMLMHRHLILDEATSSIDTHY